ncbi:MAG: 23S rRNA (uracil(1939)-C(5))-methyltransferase RlmD [Lachnospiraceae bacterium]|nr:23S rRNA (uracil(1939)-C(5))-methyltransferase RlmD [Lachnospiraceae bacterium]
MKNTAPVEKNKIYTAIINDIGETGMGIGKIDGFTVFADGALPGEEVKVLVMKVKKNYCYGKVMEIVNKSPYRCEAVCPVFKKCGGCQIMHLSYKGQLEFKTKKVKDCIERIGGLKGVEVLPALGAKEPLFYRNKAQFPVGDGKIGFYAKHSHNIIDTDKCYIQAPVNEAVLNAIKGYMADNKVSAYDEKTGRGLIRHIFTRLGKTTGEIMVCLVVNGKKLPNEKDLVERIKDIDGVVSVMININKESSNVILGRDSRLLWGKDRIRDLIGEVKYDISHLSFYQVNPEQTRVLYEKALSLADLKGGETVMDIYCGIGTISLFLAQKAKKVYGVEIVDAAIEDAKKNAELNNMTNTEFYVGKAEEVIPRLYKDGVRADVVVVDPPRKGCDINVINTIIDMKPERVVYVSCDPSTLARDLKLLVEGGFEIKEVQPVDQFPQTVHVETVCLLEKRDN